MLDLNKWKIKRASSLQDENENYDNPYQHRYCPVVINTLNQTPYNNITNNNPIQVPQKAFLWHNCRCEGKGFKTGKTDGQGKKSKKIQFRRWLLHCKDSHPPKHYT